MSNQKTNKPIDKNMFYIGIFTVAIVVVIIAIFVIKAFSDNNPSSDTNNANVQATTQLSIVAENGNQSETIKESIKLRKIDFSKTIKQVKAFEAKTERYFG